MQAGQFSYHHLIDKRGIFHITHVENLPGIIRDSGLMAQSLIQQKSFNYRNIAYDSIQDRRSTTLVPCGPRGCLHDYVPFYFAHRSPMLYTIKMGNVEGYEEGQQPIIYLVSFLKKIVASNLQYVFTDGHGIMALTDFYDDPNDFNKVDWNIMDSRYWNDTDADPDRKRRRQAEFLVYHQFPWNLVEMVVVRDEKMRASVEEIISIDMYQPKVHCIPKWYF